jgi:hypothetical protein
MADKNTAIQIASAILGSSLVVFGITTFYSEAINIPDIRAREFSNSTTVSIELTNSGRVPATNLILTTESYTNVNYEIFTTENLTIVIDDNRMFVAKFPRFVDGNGSLIRIEMSSGEQAADNPSNLSYIVYITYDQGSLKLPGERQIFTIPIGMTVLSAIAAVIVFSIPYFYSRARRERKQLYVSMVSENILYYKEKGDPFDDDLRQNIIKLNRSIKYIRYLKIKVILPP